MANKHSQSERGQALVMIVVSSILLFAAVGLVVDSGWARFRQQAAQAAADAAALAAAQAVVSSGAGTTQGFNSPSIATPTCTPTCGSGGVACQAETACPASPTTPPTNNIQAGCLYAKANGFSTGGNQNVTVTANTTSPPPNNPHVTVNYWVTAKVTETQTQLFSAVLGNRFMNPGAHSTAAIMPGPGGGGCIYITQTTNSSVTNSGNALLQSGCGIYINSAGPTAVTMSGSSTIRTTGGAKTNIVASGASAVVTSGTAAITPAPNLGVTAMADPFASMSPPTVGSCDHTGAVVVTSNTTLSPGTYCGGIITSGTQTITLSPGLYIIKQGITESGSPTFTGTGVTLYFNSGGITGSGSGTFNLSAPTSGTWQGVVLFEDRTNTSGITLSGSTGTQVSGLVYMPKGNLTYSGYSGTSGVTTTLVVNAVTFSGTSYISQPATTAYGGGCPVKLIE